MTQKYPIDLFSTWKVGNQFYKTTVFSNSLLYVRSYLEFHLIRDAE